MKSRKLIIPVIFALAAVMVVPFVLHPAEAHILKTFNNVSVKIGWEHEPPLVGDLNQVDVFVYNGTSDSAPPIADTALDNMTVTVQYGGNIKTLDFEASDDTPGLYTSAVTPDQIGTYNVIIKGSIDGATISPTTYTMQDVESKDKYYFPPMSGQNMPDMNMSNPGNQETNMTIQGNQTVPEFGPVASLVLMIAVISVVLVTGKTRGLLKF